MAKPFIINSVSGERVPFLRGILVESLVRAGLSFQDAYVLAQSIRDSLDNRTEITTDSLKERVTSELRAHFGRSMADVYRLGSAEKRQIIVEGPEEKTPFSVGILSRSLQACAIERHDALEVANLVHEFLRSKKVSVIDHIALRQVILESLQIHCSQTAADRYLSWQRFRDSGRSLIVLIGGITGTGKSTLTTELAYQLNIVRTQSTDMMREIVRCYLSAKKAPTLAYSSFEAWQGLSKSGDSPGEADQADVILGFLSQYELIKHGLEATIDRAVKEAHDLIVEGVHVLPSRLELDVDPKRFIVIPLMLVVPNKKTLAKRLKWRAHEQPARAASRYLKKLDHIWLLQSFLVAEAEENNIPLIVNREIDEALHELLIQISKTIARYFPADS